MLENLLIQLDLTEVQLEELCIFHEKKATEKANEQEGEGDLGQDLSLGEVDPTSNEPIGDNVEIDREARKIPYGLIVSVRRHS